MLGGVYDVLDKTLVATGRAVIARKSALLRVYPVGHFLRPCKLFFRCHFRQRLVLRFTAKYRIEEFLPHFAAGCFLVLLHCFSLSPRLPAPNF